MMLSYDARLLAHAARRAKTNPSYLGWVLDRYMEMENISERGLAEFLETPGLDLPRLALCLRPRANHFTDDIGQISAKFHVNAFALATVTRLVESVEAIAAANAETVAAEPGPLMAARARKKKRIRQDKKKHNDD